MTKSVHEQVDTYEMVRKYFEYFELQSCNDFAIVLFERKNDLNGKHDELKL